MQFAVPQFTDVDDRLIGSLTLKQFLVLLGTGGLVLFFWSVLGPSLIFFFIALPIAIVGVGAALGRYNGRPMFSYLVPFAAFISSNKVMIFKREPVMMPVQKKDVKAAATKTSPENLEPAESRLKKLAYMLDRKTQEEKEIITKDDKYIIKATALPKVDLSDVLNQIKSAPLKKTSETKAPEPEQKKPAKFDPDSILK